MSRAKQKLPSSLDNSHDNIHAFADVKEQAHQMLPACYGPCSQHVWLQSQWPMATCATVCLTIRVLQATDLVHYLICDHGDSVC